MSLSADADAGPMARRERIGLIDTLRGVALIAMASYHFTWDLEFFGYLAPATATTGFFRIYARAIASSFLFLAGVSLVLAHSPQIRWPTFVRRFGAILAAALAISAATYLAIPDAFIFFGILHAIGTASLIGLAFLRLPWPASLAVGIAAIALPNLWRSALFDTPLLWWVGLSVTLPRSNDYVPLLPWLGPFLIGLAAAKMALAAGLLDKARYLPAGPRPLGFIGRHSLVFYLVHQPILIGVVYLASVIAPPQKADSVELYLGNCEKACSMQADGTANCTVFCSCTLDRLLEQDLFTPLQSGAIQPAEDERILKLARECTAVSQGSGSNP